MAAEFIAEQGALKGLILALENGEEWTLGRDPDLNTIVIEDPKIARTHARIKKTESGYTIESLSDQEPVLINETVAVGAQLLHYDDLVTLGGSIFRFYPEGMEEGFGFAIESNAPDDEEIPQEPQEVVPEENVEEKEELPLEEEPLIENEIVDEDESELIPPTELKPAIFEEEESDLEEEAPFNEEEIGELHIDLTETTRFVLKVIAGPNTGAEFALDTGRTYLIGTDSATCDIVFNDLSVSREHAKLNVTSSGAVSIEDLGSRNGVLVDQERVTNSQTVPSHSVVTLGTSAFLLIDKEAPAETIAAPTRFETLSEKKETEAEEFAAEPAEETVVTEESTYTTVERVPSRAAFPLGALVLSLIICGFAVLFGIAAVSLLRSKDVELTQKDYLSEIQTIIKKYPAVRFTYNANGQKVFLLGHVKTGVEHNELLYQLKSLGFIRGIDDNIVNDEAVWQETNILLSKQPEFKGVSMHAPEAGVFVISGYLETEKQAADLMDYLNINFNYLSLLQNRVIVEQSVKEEVFSRLLQQGFEAIQPTFSNGELQLTGYISSADSFKFDKLQEDFKKIPGVRVLRNFVVAITPEQGVIDLNKKGQNKRYRVTGYSKHGDINVNVVINGRIVGRGECIDDYRITSIQPHTVFLEKDGLKYKIEYNKCKSFGVEE